MFQQLQEDEENPASASAGLPTAAQELLSALAFVPSPSSQQPQQFDTSADADSVPDDEPLSESATDEDDIDEHPLRNEKMLLEHLDVEEGIVGMSATDHCYHLNPNNLSPLGGDAASTSTRSGFSSNHSSRSNRSSQMSQSIRGVVASGSRTIGKAGSSIASGSRYATNSIAKGSKYASHSIAKGSQEFTNSIAKGSKELRSTIAKGSQVVGAQAERLAQNVGETGLQSLKKAGALGEKLVESAGAVVPMLLTKEEGQAKDAGFVVFTNLYTTQTALQMIHHPKPYTMDVTPAGDPRNIFWRNVGLPHRARRGGIIAAFAATSVLCLFYSIPMAFVSSLTEVNSLKESLPTLGRWIEEYPWLETVCNQLAPMLLLFFNEGILPVVLKYFATWEGHISSALLEASLFVKMGCFMVRHNFLAFCSIVYNHHGC